MMKMTINGRNISSHNYPYIIAELSANHNSDFERAKRIIFEAKHAGADAVKLQSYQAGKITLNSNRDEFLIKEGLWAGRTLYDLYESAQMPWEWHRPLFDYARSLDITLFSSPFDKSAVDLLEDLNAPAYKIASFEMIDLPLIRYIAQTKKPMIISTGMASFEEIGEAVATARDNGCKDLAILRCVSGYPAPAKDYNLRTIKDMEQNFGVVVGLSDHTLDNTTAITSVAMGAAIIEKHVTLDRNGGGADDSFSIEPAELKLLCSQTKTAWEALGTVSYDCRESEKESITFRRSLYYITAKKSGEVIEEIDIVSVRPGLGLAPKHFDSLIGRKLTRDIIENTPVSFDDFK